MIEVIGHWVLALMLLWPIGYMLHRLWCPEGPSSILPTFLLGFGALSVYATAWALFLPLDIWAIIGLLGINLAIVLRHHRIFRAMLLACRIKFSYRQFGIGLGFAVLWAWITAAPPWLADAYSYYLPTIDWLQIGGWVRGLGNLHFFWATGSPWHAAEALLSGAGSSSGMYWGGLWIVVFGWSVFKNTTIFHIGLQIFWILGLPFWLIMTSSSSPDIGCWLCLGYISMGYMMQAQHPLMLVYGVILAAWLKPIYAPLALVVVLSLTIQHRLWKQATFYPTIGLIAGMGGIGLWKNFILSGYPLFPLTWGTSPSVHQIPQPVVAFFMQPQFRHDGFPSLESIFWMESSTRLSLWMNQSPLEFWGTIASVLWGIGGLVYLVFGRKKGNTTMRSLYIIATFHVLLMGFISWQFRFYVIALWISGSVLVMHWIQKKPSTHRILPALAAFTLILGFYCLSQLHWPNPYSQIRTEHWRFGDVLHSRALTPQHWQTHTMGKLHFVSPSPSAAFWVGGPGPQPALSHAQMRFFDQMGYRPQPMGPSLQQGYYTQIHAPAQPQ